MWMRLRVVIGLVCTLHLSLLAAQSQKSKWSTTLDQMPVVPKHANFPLLDAVGTQFLTDKTIIVYELKSSPEVSDRKGVSDPAYFRVWYINASDGLITAKKDVFVPSKDSELFTTGFGIFIRSGSHCFLYTADLSEILAQNSIPGWNADDFAGVSVDRLGTRIAIRNQAGFTNRIFIYDLKSLGLISSSTLEGIENFSFTDHRIAYGYILTPSTHGILSVGFFDDNWQDAGKSRVRMDDKCIQPFFISADSVINLCRDMSIVNVTNPSAEQSVAKVTSVIPFMSGERFSGQLAMSDSGDIVALTLDRYKGGKFDASQRLIGTRVAIYDWRKSTGVMSISLKHIPSYAIRIAMSPSGREIAVLDDDNVATYEIGTDAR